MLYVAHTASRGAAERRGGRRVGERTNARGTQGRGRRITLLVVLAAPGYAASSACTTDTDELYLAALWSGVFSSCIRGTQGEQRGG